MSFKVPASDADKPQNRFQFDGPNGEKFSVPKLGFVNGEASLLFEQGKQIEGGIAAFDDPDARDFYAGLNRDQRFAFDAEWILVSRVSPGESDGSAGSSETTAGQ